MIRTRLAPGIPLAMGFLAPAFASQAPPRPQPYCIRGVFLGRTEEKPVTLLLRDGAIEAVLDEAAPAPAGTRVIEGAGLFCLPAFLDGFSRQGCAVPQPVKDQDLPPNEQSDVGIDMRLANRKGIQPAFRAVEAMAITKEQSEAWRKSGFGAVLVAPGGELLSGASSLATTRDAAMRDLVLRDVVFAHAAFTANGAGYPSTMMGYFSQLRQFLFDAQRHVELEHRYEQGRPGPRPPFDAELEAGAALVSGSRTLLCEADRAGDIERWMRLADEFGLSLAISGGREAWRVWEALARREVPVVLTLDWGEEVEDPRPEKQRPSAEPESGVAAAPQDAQEPPSEEPPAEQEEDREEILVYEEPYPVRLERRRKWEEGRDSALRLHEAGVRFAFGTASAKPSELLERVRVLVKQGLPADVALAALTSEAADLLGVARRLGRVEVGYDATFTLWRADPLTAAKAAPAWTFVDGFPTEFKEEKDREKDGAGPAEGLDPTGKWKLVFESDEGPRAGTLVLEMSAGGDVTGSLTVDNPVDGARVEADVEGRLSEDALELEATLAVGGFEVEAVLTATLEDDVLDGEGSFRVPGGEQPVTQTFRGTREPE